MYVCMYAYTYIYKFVCIYNLLPANCCVRVDYELATLFNLAVISSKIGFA